jgi:hypothetical protein
MRISDANVGGSYLTLLASVANLGGMVFFIHFMKAD